MDGPNSRTIPPASNTSLAVPILTYQLEGPSMAPSPSPRSIGSEIAQLTEALAPALAPVAIIAQEVSYVLFSPSVLLLNFQMVS